MGNKLRKKALLSGNEAIGLGALLAGCRFFAGYPITPSTEIAEYMAMHLPRLGGVFIQMEDELAAMGAIIGASLAGVKSLTATSGPGFSLKQENIGFACMGEIPCVIVDIMRGGPSTGFPTGPSQSDVMQARWGTHGDHPIIALSPISVHDAMMTTVRCFNLSEKYRNPVILLTEEVIAHMRERIEIPDQSEIEIIDREKPDVPPEEYKPYDCTKGDIPPLAIFGSNYRFHVTGLNHLDDGFPTNDSDEFMKQETRMMRKIYSNLDDIIDYEEFMLEDARVAIFAYGIIARSGKAAVKMARDAGIKLGLFIAKTLWPFPEKQVRELSKRVDAIIVPEMNLGQMVFEVERVAAGRCEVVSIGSVRSDPIYPSTIFQEAKRFF